MKIHHADILPSPQEGQIQGPKLPSPAWHGGHSGQGLLRVPNSHRQKPRGKEHCPHPDRTHPPVLLGPQPLPTMAWRPGAPTPSHPIPVRLAKQECRRSLSFSSTDQNRKKVTESALLAPSGTFQHGKPTEQLGKQFRDFNERPMTLPQRSTPTRSREDPPHLPQCVLSPSQAPGSWRWRPGPVSPWEGDDQNEPVHPFSPLFPVCLLGTKARQTSGSHSSASKRLQEGKSGS